MRNERSPGGSRVPLRLPAQWERQSAVMLVWPHAATDWGPQLQLIEETYFELAATLRRFEPVVVCCRDAAQAQRIGAHLHHDPAAHGFTVRVVPYDDTWVRDYGPLCVVRGAQPELVRMRFNGWGGRFPSRLDDALTTRLAELGAFGSTPLRRHDWVLEGGAIDSDGAGTLLTTTRCLLAANRNPGASRAALASKLHAWLGAERMLWLDHGELAGDDTDGHIDMLARFCGPDTIVYSSCDEHDVDNYPSLQRMQDELGTLTQRDGRPYRLLPLPLPEPSHDGQGRRLPASYANFLIVNGAVLVPAYGDARDDQARAVLAECLPGREAIGVDATRLIRQGGSIHCATVNLTDGVDVV